MRNLADIYVARLRSLTRPPLRLHVYVHPVPSVLPEFRANVVPFNAILRRRVERVREVRACMCWTVYNKWCVCSHNAGIPITAQVDRYLR
jgi:hypothetical protein